MIKIEKLSHEERELLSFLLDTAACEPVGSYPFDGVKITKKWKDIAKSLSDKLDPLFCEVIV